MVFLCYPFTWDFQQVPVWSLCQLVGTIPRQATCWLFSQNFPMSNELHKENILSFQFLIIKLTGLNSLQALCFALLSSHNNCTPNNILSDCISIKYSKHLSVNIKYCYFQLQVIQITEEIRSYFKSLWTGVCLGELGAESSCFCLCAALNIEFTVYLCSLLIFAE